MRYLALLILAVLMLLVIGCVYTRYRDASGTEVKQLGVRGQSLGYTAGSTTQPASFTTGPTPKTRAELQQNQADKLMWIGIAMMISGAVILACKAYLPLIPGTAGTYLLGLGGIVIFASFALASISPMVWNLLLVGGALGLVIFAQGFISNQNAEKRKASLLATATPASVPPTTTTTMTTETKP